MTYAKLINNKIEFAPMNKGEVLNYNTNIELMKADGYKPFVEVDRPETNRLYHISYSESPRQVKEVIVYDETQEEADIREKREEEERVANLKMTALDFLKVLYALGLTREQVRAYLDSHPEIDEELKYCQNVYCGIVTRLCPIIVDDKTITKGMIEQAFKNRQ